MMGGGGRKVEDCGVYFGFDARSAHVRWKYAYAIESGLADHNYM